MANDTLKILCSVLTTVYTVLFMYALKKHSKFAAKIEEVAPDMKPKFTPTQEKAFKANQLRTTIIGGVISVGFTVVFLLNTIAPDVMDWGKVHVDPDSDLYFRLQIAGLATLGWSWVVEALCMRAFRRRMNYLVEYYSQPPEARKERDAEHEFNLLRLGPYYFFRDPLSMSFHWFSASVVLQNQSWFLFILQVAVIFLNEFVVIFNDLKWKRFFLPQAYERYFRRTGGQTSCQCLLNGFDRKVLRIRDEKMAAMAAQDGVSGGKEMGSVAVKEVRVEENKVNLDAPKSAAVYVNVDGEIAQ